MTTDTLTLGYSPTKRPLTIPEGDRSRHLYLIGGTGSGKSVTLTNLAVQDVEAGRGFCVIDPHGDLAEGIAQRVPPDQLDRVTYFDPSDQHAPAFNLLAADFEPSKLTTDLVATFKMFFGESWGPQMEHLLRNVFLTLLADRRSEPHSFADVRRVLVDSDYRDAIVDRIPPDYAAFWHVEFPQLTKDAARPILTRLGALLVPGSAINRVMSNSANDIDVQKIMNGRGVLLVNLSKGALGEQPAKLIGGLIVTAITQAALARQRIPEAQRVPFTLFCDEFQNFADLPSTESILSEARKYQLRLVLAHQTMSQVSAQLMANILGNVRTLIGFRVSYDDAAKLARTMGRKVVRHQTTGEVFASPAHVSRLARLILSKTITDPTTGRAIIRDDRAKRARAMLERIENDPSARPGSDDYDLWTSGKEEQWPTAQDFMNLGTCHAFLMRNVASSTCGLFSPFPPPAPYPDNLAELRRRQHRTASVPTTLQSPQPIDTAVARAEGAADRIVTLIEAFPELLVDPSLTVARPTIEQCRELAADIAALQQLVAHKLIAAEDAAPTLEHARTFLTHAMCPPPAQSTSAEKAKTPATSPAQPADAPLPWRDDSDDFLA